MNIRFACENDLTWLTVQDRHISENELRSLIAQQRVLMAEDAGRPMGWLRWNLFWDNTPFMNLLYLLDGDRRSGYGSAMVAHWEALMKQQGYGRVMTSSQSDEEGQHFYRKLGYRDCGTLLLPGEVAEIIFVKEL